MDARDILVLRHRFIEVETITRAAQVDSLLSRTIGSDNFAMIKKKNPKRFEFYFWATGEEAEALNEVWEIMEQEELDAEYEMLCEETDMEEENGH